MKGNAVEYILLATLALLWGSSYLFIKIAVAEIPPITLIAIRVSIAAVCLSAIMGFRGQRFPRDRRVWFKLLIQAMLNSIGAWTVLAWGQQFVDSGLASVLNSTSPIFVFFIIMVFTRHEPVSKLKLFGACIGVFGVALIVGTDVLRGLGTNIAGQIAIIFGAFLYACAAIYGKKFADIPATVTAASTMIWASIFLVPLSLWLDQPWMLTPSMTAITAALVLSVFCTALALLIYFRLVKTLGFLGVASQSYLRAGVGVILGLIVLGERMNLTTIVGLAAAIIGVVVINFPAQTKPRPPSAG